MTNTEFYARETLAVTLYESDVRVSRRQARSLWTDLDVYNRNAWRKKAVHLLVEQTLFRGETVNSEYVTTPENAESIAERYSNCCETAEDCECK